MINRFFILKLLMKKSIIFICMDFIKKKKKKESLKKIVFSRKLIMKKLFSKNVNKIYQKLNLI